MLFNEKLSNQKLLLRTAAIISIFILSIWILLGFVAQVAGSTDTVGRNPEANLISGSVTDSEGGTPPEGTVVKLFKSDGNIHSQAQLDESGDYALGPVPNGNYLIKAIPPIDSDLTQSLPEVISMVGEALEVETLALSQPDIIGSLLQPDGVTPVTGTVKIFLHGHVVQNNVALNGEITIGGLPSETYELRAFPEPGDPFWLSSFETVTVTTGISQVVDLQLLAANVTGRVVDPLGNPVPAAVVHVNGQDSLTHRRDISARDGSFAIGDLPDDTYTLVVAPPYYADGLARSSEISFTVPPTTNDIGDVSLRSAPKVVNGKVETNNGISVEQAIIVAHQVGRGGRQTTETNENGRYTLRLGSGAWVLTVRQGEESDPQNWIYPEAPHLVHFDDDFEPEVKTVNFEVVTADAQVIGVVAMPDGSVPTFSVTVGIRNNEGLGRSATIDPSDGSFAIRVPHGRYLLHVNPSDAGYAGPSPEKIAVPENGEYNSGALNLISRDATITGYVLDDSGIGVQGVRVVGWTRDYHGARTETGPDGSYTLPVVPGDWTFRPHVPAELPFIYVGQPLTTSISSGELISDENFTLDPANNIVTGQLVNGGQPVAVDGWVGAVDTDGPVNGAPIDGGNFTLYLPDGTFYLKPHLSEGSEWLAGRPVTVSVNGGEAISMSLPVYPKDGAIAGVLWDPRTEEVIEDLPAAVIASNPWSRVTTAVNSENGGYRLGVSAGLWRLGYHVPPRSGYVALEHHQVVPVESGQTAGVPLRVTAKDGLIVGVVRDPSGDGLENAAVVVNGVSNLLKQVTLRTTTNENGEFAIRVPHGLYRVHAAYDAPDWINPLEKKVAVRANGSVTGVRLDFREPNAIIDGSVSISGTHNVTGTVTIYGYSPDGAAAKTTAELGDTYSLSVTADSLWHLGAVVETSSSYYGVRPSQEITGDTTIDLILDGPYAKPGPVAVTFDAAESQELSLSDGTNIYIPAGAMPVEGLVTLHITPIATLPHQHHARLYKYGYAFIALDEAGTPISSNFDQNVIITFSYDEAELDRLDLLENSLKPSYFSTTTQSWTIPESYVVNEESNLVVMQIDHFTDFTLLNGAPVYDFFLPSVIR